MKIQFTTTLFLLLFTISSFGQDVNPNNSLDSLLCNFYKKDQDIRNTFIAHYTRSEERRVGKEC